MTVESIDGKHSPPFSSCNAGVITEEQDCEHKDAMQENLVQPDGSFDIEREEVDLNMVATEGNSKDKNIMYSMRKQKLVSQVKQPFLEDIDEREDSKAAISSQNSKARSGNSRDCQNLRDVVEEEVVQDECSTRTRIIKRPLIEDEHSAQSKGDDNRHEINRHHTAVKGSEDFFYGKNCDSISAHPLRMKTEIIDQHKECANSDGA